MYAESSQEKLFNIAINAGDEPSSRGIAFPRKQTLTETARNAGSKQRTTFQPGSVFRSMKNAQK